VRIGLIHHQFGDGGGLEGYLSGFAQHLLGAEYEVHIIANRFHKRAALDARLRIHDTKVQSLSRTTKLTRFNEAATAKAQALDLDLTIGFGQTTAQDLHRAGGGCHKVYSRLLPPWKRLSPKNKAELALEESLYTEGGTRHYVVNSQLIHDQLQEEYGLPIDKLSVIHTAVDCERFHPPENSDPASLIEKRLTLCPGYDRALPVFLFASLDHKRKGLDALLKAWPGIDAELWIAGKPLNSAYRRTIEHRGLGRRVRALGPQADMTPIYQGADFLIHPTLYDACSNVVLQAMASGLCVLASSRDGASSFIEGGSNGFIVNQPTDADAVRKMILKALALDAADQARFSSRARERMLPLTWDAHLAQWKTLFDALSTN
jgi:UDP-glucose:(heptosyl)LPS alpha-1,3-glucosyltransferase